MTPSSSVVHQYLPERHRVPQETNYTDAVRTQPRCPAGTYTATDTQQCSGCRLNTQAQLDKRKVTLTRSEGVELGLGNVHRAAGW